MTEQPAPYRSARPAALVDDYSELGERLQTAAIHRIDCGCLACCDHFAKIRRQLHGVPLAPVLPAWSKR